ncbi:MAG: GNAT family N-acetyltransferase [Alphaproteobacteria bacterium]|nr:GNAT family N-acetyltransferase [Alphaproteobacteria bacterium]
MIRPAALTDAAAIARTIVASFEQYRDRLIPKSEALSENEASILSELKQNAGGFIAEQNSAILGCVMTKPVEGDLYFGRLSVLPTARGGGVARGLITVVEDDARRRGAPATRLNVRIALADNRRFFEKLGYIETAREAHPGFDHPTFIRMRKVLG